MKMARYAVRVGNRRQVYRGGANAITCLVTGSKLRDQLIKCFN